MKHNEIDVKLVKPRSRFVLQHYGAELVYKHPSHGQILEWKTFNGARNFLFEHSFIYNGAELNKDKIDVVEFKEEVLQRH